jgi:hypothetical protein
MMIQPHLLKFARIAVKTFRMIGILARIVERKFKGVYDVFSPHNSPRSYPIKTCFRFYDP